MTRPIRTLLAALILVACSATAARAASWQLEQPPAPAPPYGIGGVERPIGLGTIGDIKFWAPNRGVLITGGNPPAVPKGLWAYDGSSWHLLSNVCGSAAGRIAFAGPDEFWTISDPAPNSQNPSQIGTTLCHFQNGKVVASYATPTGSADPYVQMYGAACNGPDDCWFAGAPADAPLVGAFHLHWDGTTLTDVLGPQDRAVDGLVSIGGQFLEAVTASPQDQSATAEPTPMLLHRLVPGPDPASEFPNEPFVPAACATTPSYLTLGTDNAAAVWAVGGATPNGYGPCFSRSPFAARLVDGNFQELGIDTRRFASPSAFLSVAPEPGVADAWITVGSPGYTVGEPPIEQAPFPPAEVARIANDGTTAEVDSVPTPGTGQTNHGAAGGPIACPAPGDCWISTREGWLYHLTDGTPHTPDTDANFAGVIDVRPPDAGTSSFPPDGSPLDNSLANQPVVVVPPPPPAPAPAKRIALITHLHQRLRGLTLELSFTLNFRARVTFSGLRGRRLVATTGTHILAPGHRVLHLTLTRRRYPNHLRLKIVPVTTTKAATL